MEATRFDEATLPVSAFLEQIFYTIGTCSRVCLLQTTSTSTCSTSQESLAGQGHRHQLLPDLIAPRKMSTISLEQKVFLGNVVPSGTNSVTSRRRARKVSPPHPSQRSHFENNHVTSSWPRQDVTWRHHSFHKSSRTHFFPASRKSSGLFLSCCQCASVAQARATIAHSWLPNRTRTHRTALTSYRIDTWWSPRTRPPPARRSSPRGAHLPPSITEQPDVLKTSKKNK